MSTNFWERVLGQILLGQRCRSAISAHASGQLHRDQGWAYSIFHLEPILSSTCSAEPQHWDSWLRNRFFSHFGEAHTLLFFPKPFIGPQRQLCAAGREITHGWWWGCLLAISKKAISERKMGIVLFSTMKFIFSLHSSIWKNCSQIRY